MTEKKRKYPMLRSPKDKKDMTEEEVAQYRKEEMARQKQLDKERIEHKKAQRIKSRFLSMTRGRYTSPERVPDDVQLRSDSLL